MPPGTQFRIHIGIIALLLGGLLIGSGLYSPTTCTSGRGISVSPVAPSESVNPNQSVPFVELSSDEQRIFLSALEDENHQSRTYSDGPQPQFANVRAVTYKGEEYEITTWYNDCFSTPLSLFTFAGLASAVLGVGILQWAGYWRRLWDNRVG